MIIAPSENEMLALLDFKEGYSLHYCAKKYGVRQKRLREILVDAL